MRACTCCYDTFEWSRYVVEGIHRSDASGVEAAGARKASAKKRLKKRPTFEKGELRYPLFNNFKQKAAQVEDKMPSL